MFGGTHTKLQTALKELEAIGFLKPLPPDERFVKLSSSNWEIRLERAESAVEKRKPTSPLAAELIARGISRTVAERLSREHDVQYITEKIALHDDLLGRNDRRIGKNPPGFLTAAIRDNYRSVPTHSVAARHPHNDLPPKTCPQQTKLEAEQSSRLARARDHWSRLSDHGKRELESLALAAANPFQMNSYQRLKIAKSPLHEVLRDELVATYLTQKSSLVASD